MNHLSSEKSPYLLQHVQNPVDWYPWGEDAFNKAKSDNKPVFLSIGYSTCHWCHVMAHESFEDTEIAGLLNTHFVSIKVDREERPDIDHIYMTAVTALTGQGGWPLSAFLTADGRPFYGGTYFPPYAKWGAMGFKDLLLSLAQAWKDKQTDILDSAEEITALLQRQQSGEDLSFPRTRESGPPIEAFGGDSLLVKTFDTALHQLSSQFDPQYGGFGRGPKFPMGHNLLFLLRHWANSGDRSALSMAEQTLTAMGRSGMYDHLGGGFHRYATDQQWQVPHFEKMLYDQALLVLAYTEAYQVTGNGFYRRIAEETLEYVLRDLTSPQGGFYCAEDADSEGSEGLFYIWSFDEIQEVLGGQAEIFNRYYGVKPGGNVSADPHGEFTGKNIAFLTRAIDPADEAVLAQARGKLFDRRRGRVRPHLDDKILTDWNGLMIAAFAFAGSVFGQPRYIDAARKAADFILGHCHSDGALLHRWRQNSAAIDGLLEDYSFFVFGLLHLYEGSFQDRYFTEAGQLAGRMIEQFADPKGGFFMTAVNSPGLIIRPLDIYDGAIPSGNSVAAWVLVKLHYLSGEERYLRQARALLGRFMPVVSPAPHAYCFFLSALDLADLAPLVVTLKSTVDLDEATIANMRKLVYNHFVPRRIFKRETGGGAWSVHVCRGTVCLPAVNDLSALEQVLKQG